MFASFAAFHARFAGLFARPEPRAQAGKYLRALMGPVERRNGWQMAEAVGDAGPGPTQRLLHEAVWSADATAVRLREIVHEALGDPDGIGVVDETGFLKKGTASVGVARQYTGTAGKVENCQIGVFVSYVTPRGTSCSTANSISPRRGATMRRGVTWPRCRAPCASRPSPHSHGGCWRGPGRPVFRCAGSRAMRSMAMTRSFATSWSTTGVTSSSRCRARRASGPRDRHSRRCPGSDRPGPPRRHNGSSPGRRRRAPWRP